jgi:hypothetical protein
MALSDDLRRAAEAAVRYATPGEELTGIVPAEPERGVRVYLCAYAAGEERSWLVLDDAGAPVDSRALVRDTVSIAALCELAEETAGLVDGTDLRLATPERLDELGAEQGPPFAAAMTSALASVEALTADVERGYKRTLT